MSIYCHMLRKQTIVRLVIFIAAIPFLAFIIINKEPNWMYYTSLGFLLVGALYMQYLNWQNGKQAQVKTRLITYGIVILLCIVLAILMKK